MSKQRGRKVYMMLAFRGDDLDPEAITSTLKLSPTVCFRKGDIVQSRGRTHRRASGCWMKSTESEVSSEELCAHADRLLEWVTPVQAELRSYRAREGARMSVGFWWEPADGPVGFTFPAGKMGLLSEICHDLEFYFA